MEVTGVMSEEAWSSLSGMYTSKDESEILSQFLSGFSCQNDLSEIWHSSDKEPSSLSLVCSSDFCNSNECLVSQETSILSPDDGQSVVYNDESYFHSESVSEGFMRPRFLSGACNFFDNETDRFDFAPRPGFLCPPAGEPLLKSYNLRGFSDQYDVSDIGKRDSPNDNAPESKKRPRSVTDVTKKSKRNMKPEKHQKVITSDSNSSEEHSSITHQVTQEETNTSKSGCKGKSGKSASSDPQSLYARKRRERINERLRMLQGLVPNGTKVDISTMLEEAVHYVKFLQLQIKLLSSDDTWMYAPLAYNGMDIGISNIDTSPR